MQLFFMLMSIFIFIPVAAWADTHTAASCSYADVLSSYNAASDGDTVLVPAGNCTWSSQLSIKKAITFQGNGKNYTHINHGAAGDLVTVVPSADVPIRITGFHFKDSTNNPGRTLIKIQSSICLTQVRIDNNKLEKGLRAIFPSGCFYGLIDHNEFLNCNIAVGLRGDNDAAWGKPITAGTANATFIEDNTFTIDNNTDQEPNEQIYHQEGARSVVRYNTFSGASYTAGSYLAFDSHGNWGGSKDAIKECRGQPIIEFYKNTLNVYNTYRLMGIRGGSLLVHDNTFNVSNGKPNILLHEEETWTSGGPWGGSAPDKSWPATDQIFNSFFWNNTLNGSPVYPSVASSNDALVIAKNRDYWENAPQSTGGREILGSGNQTATMTFTSAGANAYYPYTPYTYPHPLISGAGGQDINAPSGLQIVPTQ